jgi:uncharacterized membrane protein
VAILALLEHIQSHRFFPHLLNGALGILTGLYLWQFLATNQDFTGPQAIPLPLGLALAFLAGPLAVGSVQALSALALSRWGRQPFRECLRQDALSLLPLALLGISPLIGFLTGWHSTAYNAGVILPVSLLFSGCLALKAYITWQVRQHSRGQAGLADRPARVILAGVIAAYALIFVALLVLRYDAYQLWGVDHARVTQGLWNTLHGRFLRFTFVGGTDLSLLSDHFELIYLLLVPLYATWPDPRLPFIVQAVALALAAWPLYSMVRRRLNSPTLALAWACIYLVLPMTMTAAQDSAGAIRPDTLAIPIFIFMLDALDRKKWPVFGVTVILAFVAKQYLSLIVAMLGLYLALRLRQRTLGLVLFVAGGLWFVLLVQVVMPALHSGPNVTLALQFGPATGEAGLAGLLQSLWQDPGQFVARVVSPYHLQFVAALFLMFGGLPLLDPTMAATTLPIFAIFALALPHSYALTLGDHHYYPVIPVFLVAAVNGVASLGKWVKRRTQIPSRRTAVAATAFALGMALAGTFFWIYSPLSWMFWDSRAQVFYWQNNYAVGPHARLADEFVGTVPAQAPVLASDYLLPHLANRPQVYHFFWPPEDVLQKVEVAVVDLLENHVRTKESMAREIALLDTLVSGPDFALTAYEDGLLFFQRNAAGGYASQVDVLRTSPHPQVRLERELGGRLRLLGYDPPVGPLRAGERCRVTYYWQVLEGYAAPFDVKLGINAKSSETHQTDYVLADGFAGPAGELNVLHLPTYVQLPPAKWLPGQVIQETYDFRLPAEATGQYSWSVGLYAVPDFLGIRFNSQRQVSGVEPITLGTLTVQP